MPRILIALLLFLLLPGRAAADLEIVVSIKPLALITEELLGNRGQVRTLISAAESPHHFSLSPSDRLALENTDLIVYVGEQLETELHAALTGLGADAPIIEAMGIDTVVIRPLVGGGVHQAGGSGALNDPHIWLDSRNAAAIAGAVHAAVVRLMPQATADFDANLERLLRRLVEMDAAIQETVSALPASPYVIYHDAIGYFEARIGRQHSLVLIEDPEMQPGIRHILEVRRELAGILPDCLLTDSSAREATIDTLMSGLSEHKFMWVELDLLGSRLPDTAGYVELIQALANDYAACLSGGRQP